jgi:hypothetical protein
VSKGKNGSTEVLWAIEINYSSLIEKGDQKDSTSAKRLDESTELAGDDSRKCAVDPTHFASKFFPSRLSNVEARISVTE